MFVECNVMLVWWPSFITDANLLWHFILKNTMLLPSRRHVRKQNEFPGTFHSLHHQKKASNNCFSLPKIKWMEFIYGDS
jgi:hypothetical protein